jgi:hypothetical protein
MQHSALNVNSFLRDAEIRSSRNLTRSFLFEAAAWVLLVAYAVTLGQFALLLLLMPLVAGISAPPHERNPIWALLFIPLFAPLFGAPYMWLTKLAATAFIRLRRRARRYRLNADRELSRDKRAPVLYLRAFYSDEESSERLSKRTDEEILVSALRGIGPVITIGHPDEKLPLLGAIRIYCSGADWQSTVNDLIARSQLLAISAGTSPGVLWEIKAAVSSAGPSRILISLMPWASMDRKNRQRRYDHFRTLAAREMIDGLRDESLRLPDEVDVALALTFNSTWNAELVKPGRLKKFLFHLSLTTLFRETVLPALDARGIRVSRSPLEVIQLSMLACGMVSPLVWAFSIFLFSSQMTSRNLAITVYEFAFVFMFFTYSFVIKNWVTTRFERRKKHDVVTLDIA